MRFARRRVAVVPLALGCLGLGSIALGLARADETPRARGIGGALVGEKPGKTSSGAVCAVKTNDTLELVTAYLAKLLAKRIEDVSVEGLEKTVHLTPAEAKEPWRARLAQLAREELGRRGVTSDPFPSPAMPGEPDPRPPMDVSADGLEIIARIVKGETWPGTPAEGEVAVASVILNRVRAKGFPDTIAGVAHQPLQFSCYNADVRAQLYWGPVRPSALDAAKKAAAGSDPVPGATHYFNPYLVKPAWAKKLKFVKRIGTTAKDTHDFYR